MADELRQPPSRDEWDVFWFGPGPWFVGQIFLAALCALGGVGLLAWSIAGGTSVLVTGVGLGLVVVGALTLRSLHRTWLQQRHLVISPYRIWIFDAHGDDVGLWWGEIAELGTGVHRGAEHLLARPSELLARQDTPGWSPDLGAYVVCPVSGWDRPDDDVIAAARRHADGCWVGQLTPPYAGDDS